MKLILIGTQLLIIILILLNYEVIILCEFPYFKKNVKKSHLALKALYIAFLHPTILILLVSLDYFSFFSGKYQDVSFWASFFEWLSGEAKAFKFSDLTGIVFSYFGAFLIILWNLRKTYESKWEYAAKMFNNLILMKPVNKREYLMKENYKVCLVLDLIEMKFENQKSFKPLYEIVRDQSGTESIEDYQKRLNHLINLMDKEYKDVIMKENPKSNAFLHKSNNS